jgi:DNA-binding NarL/FixJ family response regulator
MKKTRLLIADDHRVVRDGIRLVLQASPEYSIVAEAEDGEEAVALTEKHKPDAVIMDISMPKLNGIEATALIKQQNPQVKVIDLTVHEDEEYVYEILRAGASGYVLKTAAKKEILDALVSALSEKRFFSPGISNIIIESFIKRSKETERPRPHISTQNGGQQLTKRELEILQYIVQGYTNRKVAETLFLSIRTINTHRTNLMQKLDIHDTARLVRYAIAKGLVKLDS